MGSISRDVSSATGVHVRHGSCRWDVVQFVGAVALLLGARTAFDGSAGRSPGSMLMVAMLVSAVSVFALAVGMVRMLASAGSHLRHVFCSRYLFASGLVLLTVAFGLAVSLLLSDPFRHLLSTGRISPLVVAEAGSVGGAATCLAGATIAFVAGWEKLHQERRW